MQSLIRQLLHEERDKNKTKIVDYISTKYINKTIKTRHIQFHVDNVRENDWGAIEVVVTPIVPPLHMKINKSVVRKDTWRIYYPDGSPVISDGHQFTIRGKSWEVHDILNRQIIKLDRDELAKWFNGTYRTILGYSVHVVID